jgi:hypothetical protein
MVKITGQQGVVILFASVLCRERGDKKRTEICAVTFILSCCAKFGAK